MDLITIKQKVFLIEIGPRLVGYATQVITHVVDVGDEFKTAPDGLRRRRGKGGKGLVGESGHLVDAGPPPVAPGVVNLRSPALGAPQGDTHAEIAGKAYLVLGEIVDRIAQRIADQRPRRNLIIGHGTLQLGLERISRTQSERQVADRAQYRADRATERLAKNDEQFERQVEKTRQRESDMVLYYVIPDADDVPTIDADLQLLAEWAKSHKKGRIVLKAYIANTRSALSYAYKTQNSSEGQGDVVKALYAFYLATIEYQQNP